jgi:hypothetical protein
MIEILSHCNEILSHDISQNRDNISLEGQEKKLFHVAFYGRFPLGGKTTIEVFLEMSENNFLNLIVYFRSALKKIYEQDDSPQKLLVLCVCGVVCTASPGDNHTSTISPGAKPEQSTNHPSGVCTFI